MSKAAHMQYGLMDFYLKILLRLIIHTAPLNSVSGFLWEPIPTQPPHCLLMEAIVLAVFPWIGIREGLSVCFTLKYKIYGLPQVC